MGLPVAPVTSVVIVAYHRPVSLARLLDVVSEAALDVVVVNVGGDAAIDDVVRGAQFPVPRHHR